MHGGAPSALLARTIEAAEPGADLVVTRLTIDFLSGVPLGRVDVAASVVRPGRRFQVVEATLDAGGRHACLARAVRVRRADIPAAAASPPDPAPRLAPPEQGEPLPLFIETSQELFYPDATEIRQVAGDLGSGAVAAWIRLRGEVVAGEGAVTARARRGGCGLRQRPELDLAVARLAVRQHRADDPPVRASRTASGSAWTPGRRLRRRGSASPRRPCTTSTARSAPARSRCSSSRAFQRLGAPQPMARSFRSDRSSVTSRDVASSSGTSNRNLRPSVERRAAALRHGRARRPSAS